MPAPVEQVPHNSACETAAMRRAGQHRQKSPQRPATRDSTSPKSVTKWRQRPSVLGARTGPKPISTPLTVEHEAPAVAFRRHTWLALNDCLHALQATVSHPSHSALYNCAQWQNNPALPMAPPTSL